jgi:hypothetical protein
LRKYLKTVLIIQTGAMVAGIEDPNGSLNSLSTQRSEMAYAVKAISQRF